MLQVTQSDSRPPMVTFFEFEPTLLTHENNGTEPHRTTADFVATKVHIGLISLAQTGIDPQVGLR